MADHSEARERARFDAWWNAAREFVFNTPKLAARAGFDEGRRSLEQERWIAVEERLPGVGTEVLAWKPMHNLQVVEYSSASKRHIEVNRIDGQWWDNGCQITHWMPLPAPPVHKGDS